jgi:hypothetical protein
MTATELLEDLERQLKRANDRCVLYQAERDAALREAEHWQQAFNELCESFYGVPAETGGSG